VCLKNLQIVHLYNRMFFFFQHSIFFCFLVRTTIPCVFFLNEKDFQEVDFCGRKGKKKKGGDNFIILLCVLKMTTVEHRFGDVLLTELRRQGIPEVASWHSSLMKALRVQQQPPLSSSSTSTRPHVIIAAAGMGISDKIAIAIVESMLKIAQTSDGGAHPGGVDWSLLLGQNALTDRSAAHMQLLLTRCGGSLRRLDLAGNKGFTASGSGRILSAHERLVQRPELTIDEAAAPAAVPQPLAPAAAPSGSEGPSAATPSGSVLDLAALRLRRDQLLQQEEAAAAPTAAQRPAKGGADSAGKPAAAGPSSSSASSGGQKSSALGRQVKQPSRTSSSASKGPRHPSPKVEIAQQQRRHTSPKLQQPRPSSKPNTPVGVAALPSDSTLNVSESDDDQSRPQPRKQPTEKGRQESAAPAVPSQQPGRSAVGSSSSATRPNGQQVSSAAGRETKKQSSLPAGPDNKNNNNNDDDDDGNKSIDRVSTATTETVVPDAQDFLDITANMNPAIDSMLNLAGHTEKTPDELFGILREGYFRPSRENRFVTLTVLLLSQNNLTTIPSGTLPPTLLRVDLSNNALTSITGLERCKMLTVVNLRKNRIRRINGLEQTLCVAHLFLGRNLITYVDGLAHLLLLETLDLSWNSIQNHAKLRPLSLNSGLRHLLLIGNPIVAPLGGRYRPVMRNLCPTLVALDNERLTYSRLAESRSVEWAIVNQAKEMMGAHRHHPTSDSAAGGRGGGGRSASQQSSAWAGDGAAASSTGRMPYGQVHETDFSSLQLLTRGITPPSGYATTARAAASGNAVRQHAQRQQNDSKKKTSRPPVSRVDLVGRLSAQSQSYLEQAVVERLAAMQRAGSAVGLPGDHHHDTTEDETVVVQTDAEWSGGEEDLPPAPRQQHQPYPHKQPAGHSKPTHGTTLTSSSDGAGARLHHDPYRALEGRNSGSQRHPAASDDELRGRLVSRAESPTAVAGNLRQKASAERPEAAGIATSSVPRAPSPGGIHQQQQRVVRSGSLDSNRSAGKATQDDVAAPPRVSSSGSLGKGGGGGYRSSSGGSDTAAPPPGSRGRMPPEEAAIHPPPPAVQPQQVFPLLSSAKQRSRLAGSAAKAAVTPQRGKSQEPSRILAPSPPQDGAGPMRRAAIEKFSPIRSTLDKTDVSADDVNGLVLSMDPGSALSPLPRGKATRSGPLMPPPPPPPPSYGRGASLDPAAREEVSEWMMQLEGDAAAINASLRTLLLILHTQQQQQQQQQQNHLVGPGGARHDLQSERERCVAIVRNSGMLDDTTIPQSVVDAFGFTIEELNDDREVLHEDLLGRSPPPVSTLTERSRRAGALSLVRRVGSAKTVMRYLVTMIDERREALLQQYVAKMRGVYS
jgi:hypothetical protein